MQLPAYSATSIRSSGSYLLSKFVIIGDQRVTNIAIYLNLFINNYIHLLLFVGFFLCKYILIFIHDFVMLNKEYIEISICIMRVK